MPGPEQIPVGQIYTHLLPLHIRDFLLSDHFALFLKNHYLGDTWAQFFGESQDRPDLYGASVGKNAFTLFLLHVFHSRHEEFPVLVRDFFSSIAAWSSHPLPVFELKQDLQNLGYSENEVYTLFF
jgi:hypothetical protein